MMHLEGIPISPGYASGVAVVYDYEIARRLELPHRAIMNTEVETECERLDDALEVSRLDLKQVEETALNDPRLAGSAALLSVHSEMASEIATLVKQYIGREFVNVEQALAAVIREFTNRLHTLDNPYFRQREQDVRDVGQRILRDLTGAPPWTNERLPVGSVIVARELLPSEALELTRSGVVAIVTERGGTSGHTAIVARSLRIPAIAGIANVTSQVQPGMRLLIDGESGSLVIEPSPKEEKRFLGRGQEYERLTTTFTSYENLPCVTQDGIDIALLANIGLPEEVEQVTEHNLAGAGLFRTEFLVLESHERPSFEMQCAIYVEMASGLGDLPLVIRTFDLGGDKLPPFLKQEQEANPSHHLRGLRFSLADRELFGTQVRAILHAAQSSDISILLPMIIGRDDFAQAIAVVDSAVKQLGVQRRPAIGAMIETPASLYALDEILELADFAAIGTNDLTQYMLGADRDLAEGTDNCTAMHPAVLRAVKQVVETASRQQCPVCVCGEQAGDADFACLLVGLGVRELSLSPSRAAVVRHALRRIRCADAIRTADLALKCSTPQDVRGLLQQLLTATSAPDQTTTNRKSHVAPLVKGT